MNTHTAAQIVIRCVEYKNLHGCWPVFECEAKTLRIATAFRIIQSKI